MWGTNIIENKTGMEYATVKMCMCFAINENICPKGRRYDTDGQVRILVPICVRRQKTSRSRIAITAYM